LLVEKGGPIPATSTEGATARARGYGGPLKKKGKRGAVRPLGWSVVPFGPNNRGKQERGEKKKTN